MNWYKLFYLMTMADRLQDFFDSISDIFTVFAIISLVALLFAAIGYAARRGSTSASHDKLHEDDELQGWLAFRKFSVWAVSVTIPIALITWFLYIATPSKKDALLIVAGGAVGTFITSDSSAKQLPADVTNFLRAKIIAETEELKLENILPQKDTLKDLTKEQLIEILKKRK